MKLKVNFVIVLFLVLQLAQAQIGIGTTTPNATLDVRAGNQVTPANTDGMLVPRVDAFPVTNPTASQNGMLVFLTTATGANPPGFYYWSNATTSWIGINSSANSDADWYKVGTSTAPMLITDNMFHTGNVAIGKNTANYPLEIQSANLERAVNSSYTNATSNAIDNIGINNGVGGTSTDNTYGILNTLLGTGATGLQFGTANSITNSGNSNHHGTYNEMTGSGTGNHYGVYSDIGGNGTGKQYGSSINISNSSNAIHYGTNNNLSGIGSGFHYGVYTDLSGTGTGDQYGSYISVSNTGNAIHYGNYNDLSGIGNGNQFGSSVNINNSGSGVHYGNFSNLSGAGTGIQYGSSNTVSNSGSGVHFGNFNILSGTGTGLQYGTYNTITNSANVTHYGTFNTLDGAGTGLKYGNYNYINPAAGGTHYGIYAEVLKAGTNYAAYFLGNVAIGTTALNNYVLPPSRGTIGQIMQTDGLGNVTWQSPGASWLTTGNTGTLPATNYFGTNDDQDIVFKRNSIRAGFIGNPAVSGGNKNTSFGANALNAAATGTRNTAFGTNVLPVNGSGFLNVSIGDQSMFLNVGGSENTVLGAGALYSSVSGACNVAIGRNALVSTNGLSGTQGSNNTGVGYVALRTNSIGAYNTALGRESLYTNTSGNNNVGLGFEAGFLNSTGNNNVFIGSQAGYNEITSDKLYIENTNADANGALIYGDFNTNILRVNGQVQVGNPLVAGYALPTSRGTNNTQVLQTDATGGTAWVDSAALAITETDPQVASVTTNAVPKWNGTTLVDGVAVDNGANFGIGITPSAGNKLEVNGKTKTTNFQMTNGAVNNATLQSDATGNATWVAPISLSLARANLTAGQVLNTAGWQIINFNTVVFDINTEFNTGTNRFVALKTGYYEVNAGFHTNDQSNTNLYSIGIRKNGALYQQSSQNHSNIGTVSRRINGVVFLNVGDYIEIFAENSEAGVTIDSNAAKTYFEVKEIR